MLSYLRSIFLLIILFLSSNTFAQKAKEAKPTKAQKKAEGKKAEQLKNEKQMEQSGKEFHFSIQTKETQKRMKQSKREANRINANKRKPFWERWFVKH